MLVNWVERMASLLWWTYFAVVEGTDRSGFVANGVACGSDDSSSAIDAATDINLLNMVSIELRRDKKKRSRCISTYRKTIFQNGIGIVMDNILIGR